MEKEANRRFVAISSGLAILASLMAIAASAPSAQAACPNEAIRESQTSESLPLGTTTFPDCMALEMLSPPKKFGQETLKLNAFSSDGTRAVFASKAALADTEALQHFGGDSYIASRSEGGWQLKPTSPPVSADIDGGGLYGGGPYAFSPDLSGWSLFGTTQAQKGEGKAQFFNDGLDGAFGPLSPVLSPIDDSGTGELPIPLGTSFETSGSAADLSATVFPAPAPTTSYLPEDPRENRGDFGGQGSGVNNSYLAFQNAQDEPALQLLARDATGKVWGGRCGSFLGGSSGNQNQGAISPDGSKVFFTTRPAQPFDPAEVGHPEGNPACSASNPLRVMVRSGEGPQIEELLPGGPSEAGDDLFQAASRDGSKVFIASPRKQAATDKDATAEACSSTVGSSKGCDLYLYDEDLPLGSRLIQVSRGENLAGKHEAGKAADVLTSIAAASPDGSHVYFAAQGILNADTNPEGQGAQQGKPNLYLYERDEAHPSGKLSFIAALAAGDEGGAWGSQQTLANTNTSSSANVTPYPVPLIGGPEGGDGHTLFFLSKASLIATDQDAGKADVYRYDSSEETLLCISCLPGEPDSVPFDAFAGSSSGSTVSNFAELGRWASDDGNTAAFATAAPLSPEDEDEDVNSYLWHEGQLQRLPGKITGEARDYKLPTVSPSGDEVGFTTLDALLPIDGDSTKDAYVARVDGGFPNPTPTTSCDPLSEGSCQGQVRSAPALPSAATPFFVGPGNQKTRSCKSSQVKKRGRCVTRKAKKHKKARKKQGRAKHERGGKK